MMTKQNIIYGAICALVGSIVTLAIGVLTYTPQTASESVRTVTKTDVRVDTIRLHDTIPVERLVPHYTEVIRRDTIRQDTILLTERKDYSVRVDNDSVSDEIYASVSGINPQLDSLSYRFQIPERTITERIEIEKTITKKAHIN